MTRTILITALRAASAAKPRKGWRATAIACSLRCATSQGAIAATPTRCEARKYASSNSTLPMMARSIAPLLLLLHHNSSYGRLDSHPRRPSRKCRCRRCRPIRFHKTRDNHRAGPRAMGWSAIAAPKPCVASWLRAPRCHVRSQPGTGGTSALSTRS